MTSIPTSELARDLSTLLSLVGGGWSASEAERVSFEPDGADRVGIELGAQDLVAWVDSADRRERVFVTSSDGGQVSEEGRLLMRKIVAVLNQDLLVVGDRIETQEIWKALSPTRFLRAAARLSNISTDHLVGRIRIFEAAARQTYEGSPFVGSVVMPHNIRTFRAHAVERFRPFSSPMTFGQALLREKWLKPFLEGGDFALVTVSRKGMARGFTDATSTWASSLVSPPTAQLEGLYGYLTPGTSVLSASPSGDIYFALPSGATFVNSKGLWRYQNWSPLKQVLSRHCRPEAVENVMQLVRSSSYSHHGALFVILPIGGDVLGVIPDHGALGRSAETLRATVEGIQISDPLAVRLLDVASRIDGAVVLDERGGVIDVASMVAEPSIDALSRAGHCQLRRFSGARSTAAWNASIQGLAIKVSDDGPIDVYERGHQVFHSA